MSKATVIYWRDIPTQVTLGAGRRAIKRPLADRFMVAIDKAAMASGASDTDAYLAAWHKQSVEISGSDPEAVEQLALNLEQQFPAKRLAEIARQGGWMDPEQDR